jgi:hypothetical protein
MGTSYRGSVFALPSLIVQVMTSSHPVDGAV